MSSSIENLAVKDPFADVDADFGKQGNHIRTKKSLTTVTGLPADLDFKKILKAFKKLFSCNGSIVEDADLGTVLQLQGDHRQNVVNFLTSEGIAEKANIKVHGS